MSTTNVTPFTPATQDDGLGTVSFVIDSDECFGQIRMDGELVTIRGTFSAAIVALESSRFGLTMQPIARPVENGPRLRGVLVDRDTGEAINCVAWAPTKGGKAYGLSRETRPSARPTYQPF